MLKDIKARTKYFDNVGHRYKETLKAGYSFKKLPGYVAVHTQAATKPSHKWKRNGPHQVNTISRSNGSAALTIYKKGKAPAKTEPVPEPTPEEPKAPPKGPIEYSSEIQQAKDRVNAYENGKSPWEQAQANVQNSFIKDTDFSPNKQYDFSGNTFEATQSSKLSEQAQAAQNQMQNYVSKYSGFKSSTN